MAPPLAAQSFVQILEICFQMLLVLHLGHAIHARCRIDTLAVKRPPQSLHIDQVCQRVKLGLGSRLARSATFRSPGDMDSKVCASVMVLS